LLAEADRFSVPRRQELLGDGRLALDNWTEHATAEGLRMGKTDELRRDFLVIKRQWRVVYKWIAERMS
jgi:hypothetical protein